MIEVDIRGSAGAFPIAMRFRTESRLTALFGASGAGKTTLVNMIAGLARPDAGRIAVDGFVLVDTAKGVFLPAHHRRIGYVFQDSRLFPHLTVRRNLSYGRWFTPRRERKADLGAIVDLLGIGGLLDRLPETLSGGERQRVAIGRALLADPRLILMDEPLASLDEPRRAEILPYLERLRDEGDVPIVYVSHSVQEVARLAGEIVVIAGGRVAETGPAGAILRRMDLLPEDERGEGGALIEARVARHDEAYAMTVLDTPAGPVRIERIERPPGAPVRLRIRARDVMIATEPPRGLSALNVLAGTVSRIRAEGTYFADVALDCGGQPVDARITRQSAEALGLKTGDAVYAVVKSVSLDAPAGRTS